MCEYCEEKTPKTEIFGKRFKLEKTAGYTDDIMKHDAWIMKNKNDKKAGIMFCTYGSSGVYFDIDYCPMCGRKLV